MPPRLSQLNWIDWDPGRPASTLGFIVNGLLADPSRYRISQQLALEATAWAEAGRRPERLIADRGRARQMSELLAGLTADPLASPDPVTVAFVAASERATRKTQRRRLLWRGGAVLAVLVAIGGVTSTLPKLRANARINHAAIVTAGNTAMVDQMPEWSAANAATLMIEGTDAERRLGRSAVVEALSRPWSVSYISWIDSVITAASYDDGRRAAVLSLASTGSALAVVEPQRAETLGATLLPRRFESLDVARDGSLAAVAGEGAGTLDLRTGRFHSLTAQGRFAGVRILGEGWIALWDEDGRLELRDTAGGRRTVGGYEAVLDVVGDGRGGGHALLATAPGAYEIVDLPSGAAVASGRVSPGFGIGTLSPDGRRAIVDGGDEQLWLLGAGGPRPTGIAVPAALNDLAWGSGERLLAVSDSAGGEVLFLPRAERLGRVCARAPRVPAARIEPGGEMVACAGDARSFWLLPQPPRPSPPAAAHPPQRLLGRYATAQIRGRRLLISTHGPLASSTSPWGEPFDSAITAAAFAGADRQIAVGSARGSVSVIGITGRDTSGLVNWRDPDGAPIASLRWRGQRLLAATSSGQTWQVPTCPHCETPSGLVTTLRSRFSGCFSALQLAWIDAEAQRRLGLRECAPIETLGD